MLLSVVVQVFCFFILCAFERGDEGGEEKIVFMKVYEDIMWLVTAR